MLLKTLLSNGRRSCRWRAGISWLAQRKMSVHIHAVTKSAGTRVRALAFLSLPRRGMQTVCYVIYHVRAISYPTYLHVHGHALGPTTVLASHVKHDFGSFELARASEARPGASSMETAWR